MQGVQSTNWTIFRTEVFAPYSEKNIMQSAVAALEKSEQWTGVHHITKEKATAIDAFNAGWLYLAVYWGYTEIIERITPGWCRCISSYEQRRYPAYCYRC